jgi:hypothetical protein
MIIQIALGTTILNSAVIKTDNNKFIYDESVPGNFSFKRSFNFSGNLKHYFSHESKMTFAFSGSVLYIPGSEQDTAAGNYFFLGGLESLNKRSIPMVGFHANEIPVRKTILFGTDFDFEVSKDFHISLLANIAAVQESGLTDLSLLAGFGLAAGYMSVIGPLKAGIMYGTSNRERYFKGLKSFISIGYRF